MATETRWEGAVLEKLTSNGERIAVVERDLSELNSKVSKLDTKVSKLDTKVSELDAKFDYLMKDVSEIKALLGWLKWIGGAIVTIALALVANAISTYVLHF